MQVGPWFSQDTFTHKMSDMSQYRISMAVKRWGRAVEGGILGFGVSSLDDTTGGRSRERLGKTDLNTVPQGNVSSESVSASAGSQPKSGFWFFPESVWAKSSSNRPVEVHMTATTCGQDWGTHSIARQTKLPKLVASYLYVHEMALLQRILCMYLYK